MKIIIVIALALELLVPVNNPRVTSPYGHRDPIRLNSGGVSLRFHQGIDFVSHDGITDVLSIASGVIIESWPTPNGYYRGHEAYGGLYCNIRRRAMLPLWTYPL